MADPIQVEIYSDVVCPWCYIGARRFGRAVETLWGEDGIQVAAVYRPFQLDPQAPRSPAEPVADVYARKFGGADRAAQMISSITELAAAEGLDFRLVDGDEGLEAVAVGLQRAALLDITSVPTYVVGDAWAIPGAQDPDVFVAAIRRFAAKRSA